MPDSADEAQARSEAHLKHVLGNRPTLTIPFSGSCLSCGEPVGKRRYCDADCRADHELVMLRRSRS